MASRGFSTFTSVDDLNDLFEEVFYDGLFNLRQQLIDAVAHANARTAKAVVDLGEILQGDYRNVRRRLQSVNTELAREAQGAIVAEYERVHAAPPTRHPRADDPTYRVNPVRAKNRRYAGGMLLNALEDPSMVEGTYDGIGLVNTAMLDRRAKQWHRLNFGAGGAAGPGPQMFTVNWSNLAAASFGFDTESPSTENLWIPPGWWVDGAFFPRGPESGAISATATADRIRQRATRIAGFTAWNFLDAGPRSIAENMSEAYGNMLTDLFDLAVDKAKGPYARIGATIRPNFSAISSSVSSTPIYDD